MPGLGTFENSYSSGGGGGIAAPVSYNPPEYDDQQIKAYQQEALAPGVSGLRRLMREAQAGRYSSPSARREALRGAVRGYGEALAPLQVGAGAQARQRYNIQYQQEVRAEEMRVAQEMRDEERAYQEWLRDEAQSQGLETTGAEGGFVNNLGGAAPQTTFNLGGQTWTQPGTSSVVGLGEASRRALPESASTQPQLQIPAESAYSEDWMY